jgi:hypothetical protein
MLHELSAISGSVLFMALLQVAVTIKMTHYYYVTKMNLISVLSIQETDSQELHIMGGSLYCDGALRQFNQV